MTDYAMDYADSRFGETTHDLHKQESKSTSVNL
jgi:hypothetical protein